ncbi:MAG: NAD(P)H-dependent oxidoreductase subunit E [Desulfobacterales bacterium]|nr:NAD(P)H-dependent oxidoreductase subunit E [Desulfobacterales bacterium]
MDIKDRIRRFPPQRDYLLNILHDLQQHDHRQHLPREALQAVAEYLNITLSAVYGVAGYYSMFSLEPRGKYLIRVCKSPVCCTRGAFPIIEALKEKLGVEAGETTADGLFTLEMTECLGGCDGAPCMMINEHHYGGLTAGSLNRILNRLKGVSS